MCVPFQGVDLLKKVDGSYAVVKDNKLHEKI